MLHINEVKHIQEKIIWVAFDDGVSGRVNLEGVLTGPIFIELNDTDEFSKVFIDKELETIVWPNGADLAPEFVKQLLLEQNPSRKQG